MNTNWVKPLLQGGAILAIATVSVAPAYAADEGADEAAAAPAEGEIVVSGSRINKAGFQAPTPTTVVTADSLEAAPQPNVAQNLNQLPVLSGSNSPRTAGNGVGGGLQGANFLNLRNLGANRTLVLLDHRRVVGAATTGVVDLNLLPTALLKQVDIVTGGASAAWGSDAVAGVVNLVLDRDYTGLKGTAQAGQSTYGDANEYRVEFAGGTGFAGGRGHIIVSGSWSRADSVDRADSRPWFVGSKLFTNPAYVAGNGQPRLIVADRVGSSTATTGGLITGYRVGTANFSSGGLVGTNFGVGGTTSAFNFGTVGVNATGLGSSALPSSYAGAQLQINGTPNDFSVYDQLIADTETYSGFARVSFDVTDNVNLYGEFIYGRSTADSLSVPYLTMAPNGAPLTILRSNAYLPAAVATQMDTLGASQFTLGRYNLDLGFANPHNERELFRYVAGADLDLGGSWKAQVYYEHARSNVLNEARNNANVFNFGQAVDAVVVTAANVGTSGLALGSTVCRSTLTTPTNGCVPFNVFGPQTPTDAQRAWLLGTAIQDIRLTEDVVAASVNGDLFELPGGPVSVAFGAEYRSEDHVATADTNSQRDRTNPNNPGTGNWWVGNYKPSSGGYNVKEAFAEIAVPVFKDSPLGQSFDFNGAIRVTDYSTSGTVTTWKAGATWDIAGGFKLRGVFSRDIRAPNLNEYFLGGSSNSVSVIDGPNGAVGALRIQSGNTSLVPEIAKTFTIGAVYQPVEVPGLSFAIDYFRIKIDGAIATPTPQYIVDRCRDGSIPGFCSLLVRNSSGVLTTILVQPFNYRTEFMSGVDLEAGYRTRLGSGNLSVRSLWTLTSRRYLVDNGVVDVQLGELAAGGGPVKLRGFNSVSWDSDRFGFSLRHRFIGSGVFDAAFTSTDIADNTVPAVNYFDLSATAKFNTGGVSFELFGAVDNLFNKAPPKVPNIGGNPNTNLPTNGATYDLIGRFFRAGLRFKF